MNEEVILGTCSRQRGGGVGGGSGGAGKGREVEEA